MTDALEHIQATFPTAELGVSADRIPFLRVEPVEVPSLIDALARAGYQRFVDLTVVDDPSRPDRFELQYLFHSMDERGWVRVKARTADEAPTIVDRCPAANWYEREVYDLFGVRFQGHPDLQRIQMPDDWVGHPLRRDEPVGGEPVEFSGRTGGR